MNRTSASQSSGKILPAFVAALVLAGVTIAQPPNYSKWTGTTALPKPQGTAQGDPLTLTWGFMALGTPINDGGGAGNAPNVLQTRLNEVYGSQAVWQPHFQSVFDRWSSISGLSYVFEANDDGAAMTNGGSPVGVLGTRADIRIGGKLIDGQPVVNGVPQGHTLAYNYFPSHGDMVIDTGDFNGQPVPGSNPPGVLGGPGQPTGFYNNLSNNSRRLRNVVAHEHGHGIGMPHNVSNNAAFLLEPSLNTGFDGPQYQDILAAQRMYGDFYEKSFNGLGNDMAVRATPLGTATGALPLRLGQSAKTLVVSSTETDFVSIDDNTDTDFYSFNVATAGRIDVTLEALGFTYNITPQSGMGDVPFDTTRRSDLALALFGTNGSTLLTSANLNGLGGNESLFFNLLAGGTYFLRVTGVDNNDIIVLDTQFYGLILNFTLVPEPATLAMIATAAISVGAWRRVRRR